MRRRAFLLASGALADQRKGALHAVGRKIARDQHERRTRRIEQKAPGAQELDARDLR